MPRAGMDEEDCEHGSSHSDLTSFDELVDRLVDVALLAEGLGERSVFMAVVLAIEILDPSTADSVRQGSRMLQPWHAEPDEDS